MDYILEFTQDHKVLYDISFVRIYKGVYLLIEVVGPEGRKTKDCYLKQHDVLPLEYKDKIIINQ